jgi:hypothetical protein
MTRTSVPAFEPGTLNAYLVEWDEIKPGDRYGYKVVAVIDENIPCWRAYRGPTGWTDEQVAENCDSITETAARALFPTIAATMDHKGGYYRD